MTEAGIVWFGVHEASFGGNHQAELKPLKEMLTAEMDDAFPEREQSKSEMG